MKLQLTIASGTVLDVEIRLEDTFKSLITRTYEQSGINLQLFHFEISGKKIKYSDNVVNYFVGPAPAEPELCSYFPAQLCRLCAKTAENMEFIFHDESRLEETINTWLPTHVSETDMLPKQVCNDCIEKLQMCKTFQVECVQAEVILKDLLNADKFSISKKHVEVPVEETTGPRVFECGFVFGPRGSLNTIKKEKKLASNYCCPLCYEGSMVNAGKYKSVPIFDETAHSVPTLSVTDIICEEIKMEPYDDYDFEDVSFDISAPVIKTETELDFEDEEVVIGDDHEGGDSYEMNEDDVIKSTSATTSNALENKQSNTASKEAPDPDHEDFEQQIPFGVIRVQKGTNISEPEAGGDTTYKCAICEECAGDMDELLEHSFELHSDAEFFPCPFCPLAFDVAPQLMNHFECKHNPDDREGRKNVGDVPMHRCAKCLVFFPSEGQLSSHQCVGKNVDNAATAKTNKPNRKVKCPTCGKSLNSKIHLEFHMQFHMDGARPLHCQICSEDFETEESLYKHFRWFHNNQEPKCSVCDKSFANYNTLIIHKKLHSNVRNYRCGTCSKSFLDKQTLAEHMVTHMDTTPFQCPVCDKYLARNSRLKQHMLIHKKRHAGPQEVFDCCACRQAFPDRDTAVSHGDKCHEGADGDRAAFEVVVVEKVVRCEFCNRDYASVDALNTHRTTAHPVSIPKRFGCEFCDATFESFARLTSHKLKHGSPAKDGDGGFAVPLHYMCDECEQTYYLWSYLSIHKRQKHAEVRCLYTCKLCPESFDTSWSLAYHRKAKHGQATPRNSWWGKAARIHECLHCDKLFASQILLTKHQVYHHAGEKSRKLRSVEGTRVQCDTCGKTFHNQAYLEKHKKVHIEGKSEICPHCNKKFVHESSLRKHLKTHTSRFPHQCSFCEKRFLMKHDLEVHTRRHTGYKPHHCNDCDKAFRTKSMLVQHMRIHTNERPYSCNMCNLSFRRSWALKNHERIHTGQKPFVCPECNRAFRVKQELNAHLARMHPKEAPAS